MKISWWDRNVKIRYKCLVVIDEFLTVSLYQPKWIIFLKSKMCWHTDAGPQENKNSTWCQRLQHQCSRLELSARSPPSHTNDWGNVCQTLKACFLAQTSISEDFLFCTIKCAYYYYLWSLCVIGQTIYIFIRRLFFFFLSFFPRLISAVAEWMSAIPALMVWP